jgi:hypothetical protein
VDRTLLQEKFLKKMLFSKPKSCNAGAFKLFWKVVAERCLRYSTMGVYRVGTAFLTEYILGNMSLKTEEI